MVRQFDAQGRLVSEDHSGSRPQSLAYRYDAASRLTRVDERAPDGDEHVRESYLYHDDGTSTVTQYIDPPLRDQNIAVSVEMTMHFSLDAVSVMTLRNREGRPITKVFYDVDNRVIRRVRFCYDAAGHLLEEGEVESGSRLRTDMCHLYRYDAAGRQCEAEMHSPFFGARKLMSYNERGDLSEVQRMPLADGLDLHEQEPWAERLTYEYDDRDNWTMRTAQARLLDSGVVTYTVAVRRSLQYHDRF